MLCQGLAKYIRHDIKNEMMETNGEEILKVIHTEKLRLQGVVYVKSRDIMDGKRCQHFS